METVTDTIPELNTKKKIFSFFSYSDNIYNNLYLYFKPILIFMVICAVSALIFIGLDSADPQWRALYMLIIIVISWIINYVDIVVVGFFPLILGSVLTIMPLSTIMGKYVTTTTLLYTTASMIGGAFQKHGLDRRFALAMLTGSSHQMYDITWRFAIIGWFISMWISDTATMTLLIPILEKMLNIVEEWKYNMAQQGIKDPRVFKAPESNLNAKQVKVVSYLVLAYSTCIGGMSTMIGATTNFAFLNQFTAQFPEQTDLTFTIWFAYAIPMAIITLFFCWLCAVICWEGPIYTLRLFIFFGTSIKHKLTGNNPNKDIPGVKEYLKNADDVLEKASIWKFAEKILCVLFPCIIILLFLRNPGIPGFGGWNSLFVGQESEYTHDSMVTTFVAILLFMLPAHSFKEINKAIETDPTHALLIKESMLNKRIINWKEASAAVEWGVMWIFGGGYAIAAMIDDTGLGQTLADGIADVFYGMSSTLILFITIIVGSVFTEFMSSTNVIAILTPILNNVALTPNLCINPLFLSYNAVFTAASGTLLPISTTSNVLAYKAANVTIPQMFRTGALFKVFSILIVFVCVLTYGIPLLNLDTFPQWAQDYIYDNPDIADYDCMNFEG